MNLENKSRYLLISNTYRQICMDIVLDFGNIEPVLIATTPKGQFTPQ